MAKTPKLYVGLYVWEKVWQTVNMKEKHIYAGTHPGWTELIKKDNIIPTASIVQRQQKRWVDYTSYELPPQATTQFLHLHLLSPWTTQQSRPRETTAPLIYLDIEQTVGNKF